MYRNTFVYQTTGACLAMDFDDLGYGSVGAPLGGVKLRLKDWPEGGYSFTDKVFQDFFKTLSHT